MNPSKPPPVEANGSPSAGSWVTSTRELLLWIATALAVAAIYATLGLASTFSGLLYSQAFSAVAFLAGMLLIGATILSEGLSLRPGRVEVGLVLGIVVVSQMLLLRMTVPERSHLIEYAVVAVFVYEALTERARNGRRVPVPALLAITITTAVGTLDEGIQALLPSRVFDVQDILFNFLAALFGVAATAMLAWTRRAVEARRDRAR